MSKLTEEQRAAVEAEGKVIVSASAGSGKTFVMIEKLVNAIAGAPTWTTCWRLRSRKKRRRR